MLASYFLETGEIRKKASKAAAWLSSARAVGCRLQCRNERNPCFVLNIHKELPRAERGGRRGRRQVSMALMPRATHTLQWDGQWVAKPRGGANPIKPFLSWDCRLQFACMNPELVVIADQKAAVNTFSLLVHTARQASKVVSTRNLTYVGLR